MRKLIIAGVITFAVGLLIPQFIKAQGTVYFSNLGQSTLGSQVVGSDSWLAASFKTGTNASGYTLDSIQLGMTNATGNPTGFLVMLYATIGNAGGISSESLGTLDGSLNPTSAGIFTYTPTNNLMLSPGTDYFIVLTAGTAIANGAYEWNLTLPVLYSASDGWRAYGNYESSDGSIWFFNNIDNPQFAINATPVPEPGVFGLSVLSGLFFLVHRRKAKAV